MTLVEKLVRTYSPSGSEKNAVDVFLGELKRRGYDAYEDEAGNAIGIIGNGPIQIYLIGHIDTVPGDIPIRLDNGILYGRGSVDAKGCLASFCEAGKQFSNSKKITLTVVGCVREETDSMGAYHLKNTLQNPDYLIIGEPSGWEGITLGYRGAMSIEYKYDCSRHHHGAPEKTPPELGIEFYTKIFGKFASKDPAFERVSLRLVNINSYEKDGIIGVKMNMDLRTPENFNFNKFILECKKQARGASFVTNKPMHGILADKKNQLVRSFLGGIRKTGGKPVFKKKTGSSDMNILADWGCPMIAYGPGDSALDHTIKEHLYISEYDKTIEILTISLERLGEP
tara:strand:- start:58517 stop:59536 length:1020 start_codon:yes stop_codon:yes gene_type:complete